MVGPHNSPMIARKNGPKIIVGLPTIYSVGPLNDENDIGFTFLMESTVFVVRETKVTHPLKIQFGPCNDGEAIQ